MVALAPNRVQSPRMAESGEKGLTFRWVGEEEAERVALARMLSFGSSQNLIEKYRDTVKTDLAAQPRHFLLAELDGRPVGTATSLDMTMWVRGTPLPCQGVAYVGTVKTHRRIADGPAKGIATQLMNETLRLARERGHALSALMPFRVSYYEHFGYGIVEGRTEWSVPLSILPAGSFEGFRFYQDEDHAALLACHQRIVQGGHCDIERPDAVWRNYLKKAQEGLLVVDRPKANGPIHGWMTIVHVSENGKDYLKVTDRGADSPAAFTRQLNYLSSLRDQYAGLTMILPSDVPLNWLLKERQLPHRPVNHATGTARPFTRMQLRILDHRRYLEALRLPEGAEGSAFVAIREPEGTVSKFRLDVDGGRCTAGDTAATADATIPAHVWASIATGHLRASDAARLGLFECANDDTARVLDVLADGPRPFTHEYF
jgi:predicted acetyltransferase